MLYGKTKKCLNRIILSSSMAIAIRPPFGIMSTFIKNILQTLLVQILKAGAYPMIGKSLLLTMERMGIDSHDGVCTITGAAGSRFGVGCMAFEFSDNKPYRVVSKINSYFGTNAILHITTTEPHSSFDNFIEFGIEGGKLKVFTSTESWTGDSVSTPARLTVEISPYGEHGRNITFICNGEPVYYLENTTALPNSEFRLFLYGYGNSVSAWDYADAYPIQSWQPDGVNAWGKCEQEYSSSAVSGNYMAHISIEENNGGSLGISHGGISITGGHAYQLSMWLKSEGAIQSIIASLGEANAVILQILLMLKPPFPTLIIP